MNRENPHPEVVRHVTIVPKRGRPGRNGCWTTRRPSGGVRTNLCGGDLTAYDIGVREAPRMNADELRKWNICPQCLRVLTERPS